MRSIRPTRSIQYSRQIHTVVRLASPSPLPLPTTPTALASAARNQFFSLMENPTTATPPVLASVSQMVALAIALPGDLLDRPNYAQFYRMLSEKRPQLLQQLMQIFFEAHPNFEKTYAAGDEQTKDLFRLGAIMEVVGDSNKHCALLMRLGLTNSEDGLLALASHIKNLNEHIYQNLGQEKDPKWLIKKTIVVPSTEGMPMVKGSQELPFDKVQQSMGGLYREFERKAFDRLMWKMSSVITGVMASTSIGFYLSGLTDRALLLASLAIMPLVFAIRALYGDKADDSNVNTLIRQMEFHRALAQIPLKIFNDVRHNITVFSWLKHQIAEISLWKSYFEDSLSYCAEEIPCVVLKGPLGVFVRHRGADFLLTHEVFQGLLIEMNQLITRGETEITNAGKILAPIFADQKDYDVTEVCNALERAIPAHFNREVEAFIPRDEKKWDADRFFLFLQRHATACRSADGGPWTRMGFDQERFMTEAHHFSGLVKLVCARDHLNTMYRYLKEEVARYKHHFGAFTKANVPMFEEKISAIHNRWLALEGNLPTSQWFEALSNKTPNLWSDATAYTAFNSAMEALLHDIEPIKALLVVRNGLVNRGRFHHPDSAEIETIVNQHF